MRKFLEFRKYPLDMILEKLLIDKTTRKNIIWATDSYSEYGDSYCDRYEITLGALQGINPILIQPRAFKAIETQQQRTKSKAEVFTPSWIVNKMISHLDEEWFGRPNIFNVEDEQSWKSNTEKIDFKERNWKDYVDQTVLEITCGEAPFIVSRYNASTGEIIPIEDRIGILDRKLRVVTENTGNEEDWLKWTKRAFESVYGYEYQGDNLLIGRINLLMTFLDYYQSVWKKDADKSLLVAITNIITWNFWQMDGLNGTVPLGVPKPLVEQMTLFDIEEEQDEKAPLCKVRKWRTKKTILYKG
ncbi:restriction endonuclease subunit M, partial [Dubosiella newyorkensis]